MTTPIHLSDRMLRAIIAAYDEAPDKTGAVAERHAMAVEIQRLRLEVQKASKPAARAASRQQYTEITNIDSEIVANFIRKFQALCASEHVPAACAIVIQPKDQPNVALKLAGHSPTIRLVNELIARGA